MEVTSKTKLKRDALVKATINLVNNNGFHATPMSKIAKMANVSPGTIYLYFENKQDLVNQVYIEVKKAFTTCAFKEYDTSLSVEKGFETVWKGIADFKLNEVEEALFLSQCDSSPVIDEESRQEGLKHLQPLLDLWERGQKEGIIKTISPFLLYAYTIYPLSFLMTMKQRGIFEIDQEQIEEAYKAAWNSISVESFFLTHKIKNNYKKQ
jgi:AcrR family transcriptional regulator